jgi:hypothetical protein
MKDTLKEGEDAATFTRERPGMSAFVLEDGIVYHAYSTYAHGDPELGTRGRGHRPPAHRGAVLICGRSWLRWIRIALGATATQMRVLVLRQAVVVLRMGLVVGTFGALVLGRWLSALVFEVSPWDPRILLVSALLLTTTGLVSA